MNARVDPRRVWGTHLFRFVALALAYAACAELTWWLIEFGSATVAFFPAAGITFAVMVRSPRRRWPLLVAAIALGEVVVDLRHGSQLWHAFVWAGANGIEPVIGAALALRFARGASLERQGDLVRFVLTGCLAAPLVAASIGGPFNALAFGGSAVTLTWQWWLGDALGVLVVAPMLLCVGKRWQSTNRRVELVATVAASVGVIAFVMWSDQAFAFTVIALVGWVAVRHGIVGVAPLVVGSALLGEWGTARGHGTFVDLYGHSNGVAVMQLFLGVTTLTGYALAAAVAERDLVNRHLEIERIVARSERDRARAIIDASPAAIVETDTDGNVTGWNAAAERIFGWTAQEVIGQPCRAPCASLIEPSLAGRHSMLEGLTTMPSGRELDFVIGAAPIGDPAAPEGVVAVTVDRSDRLSLRAEAEWTSTHDTASGLLNSLGFDAAYETQFGREGVQLAVAFGDVPRFEPLVAGMTSRARDALIGELAQRLLEASPAGSLVARLGLDEFVVAWPCSDAAVARERATEIRSAFGRVQVNGRPIPLDIGIALGDPGDRSSSLLRDARAALDLARRDQSHVVLFETDQRSLLAARRKLADELAVAIDSGAITAFYQPKVELLTGRIVGFEALARWMRGGDWLSPETFVSIAEECGLIGSLGDLVLAQALRELAMWRREFAIDNLCVAVNVSVVQLADLAFVERVEQLLDETGVPAEALELEITESVFAGAPEIRGAVERLRGLGLRIAIDDFGTGYSSLASLHTLPVDVLKIDRSFVTDLGARVQPTGVAAAIVSLANLMRLDTVAEGIETHAHLASLIAMGCHIGQGFLFSRAVPASLVGPMLRRGVLVPPLEGSERTRGTAVA